MRPAWIGAGTGMALGVLLLSSAGWSNNPPTNLRQGNPDRGLAVYDAYCAGCHGFDGRGDGPVAPRLSRDYGVRPRDLSDPDFQAGNTDAELMQAIKQGGKDSHRSGFMPAWGLTLNQGQLEDLVAYVRELRDPDRGPTARAFSVQETLDLGRILFGLRCLACHGGEGRGDGPFIQSLQESQPQFKCPDIGSEAYLRRVSDEKLENIVQLGPRHSKIPNLEAGWWDNPLQPNELRALLLYLRTLPLGRDQ